jgi:hypothetical protein
MTNLKIKLIDIWCMYAVRMLTVNDFKNCIEWFKNSTNISSESLKNRLMLKLIENGKL